MDILYIKRYIKMYLDVFKYEISDVNNKGYGRSAQK